MNPTWTFANVILQTVAGLFGAIAGAAATKEHAFGFFGHVVVGTVAGAFSGYFTQRLAATVVTGSGSFNEISALDNAVIQILTGACAGAIAMRIVGLLKHSVDQHRSGSN